MDRHSAQSKQTWPAWIAAEEIVAETQQALFAPPRFAMEQLMLMPVQR